VSRIVIRPQAHRDIDDQFRHLSGQSIDLALRFFDAVHATIKRLAASPDLGITYEFRSRRLKGIHWWKVRGFRNHLVFYRAIAGGIEVVRILHATRDIPSAFRDN
jgi:toxin ParE1/3/4